MGRPPRLLWASPLPPVRSGIADHAAGLLDGLAPHAQLTVLHPPGDAPRLDNPEFRLVPADRLAGIYATEPFDLAVYHMGNHPLHRWIHKIAARWPGLMVMHDTCFHHYYHESLVGDSAREYLGLLLKYHGSRGLEFGRRLLAAEAQHAEGDLKPGMFGLPLTGAILEHAAGAVVHNRFARLEVEAASALPVHQIPLYCNPIPAARIRTSSGPPLLISVGFTAPHKRLDAVLHALAGLVGKGIDFRFTVAGALAADVAGALPALTRNLGLAERVSFTGWLPDRELEALIERADVAINLRYPTAGESSASLIHLLGAGLPVIVTDYGASAEFPSDVVCKVAHDEREPAQLSGALERLLTSGGARRDLGARAREFIGREHSLPRAVSGYLSAIEETLRDRRRRVFDRAQSALKPNFGPLGPWPAATVALKTRAQWERPPIQLEAPSAAHTAK